VRELAQRDEQAAAVAAQRPHVELPDIRNVHDTDPLERHDAVGARGDLDMYGVDVGIDGQLETPCRIVSLDRDADERVTTIDRNRRLRMAREQVVALG